MRALLDINVLIALLYPQHIHHARAHRWFAGARSSGWASCPLTENGCVRILSNPAYSRTARFPAALVVDHLRCAIQVPDQWSVTPPTIELEVVAEAESAASFQVQIPTGETAVNRRRVVTGDVWRDGEHLGEITELLVNMRPMTPH